MIINITCPNCNFSKKVPRDKIPEGLKYAKCPRCKNTFELPSIAYQDTDLNEDESTGFANDTETVTDTAASADVGYFTGLIKTLKGVLFTPAVFFNSVRNEESIKDPFAFGLLLGSIGFMFDIFWAFLLKAEEVTYILETLSVSININHIFITYIIISPFLVLMFMLVSAVILHLCLYVLRGAHRGFIGTFRVSAYSTATLIFCFVPYVGEYVAFIWWLVVLVKGLREVHETSTLKAVFSLLLPLFLFLILATAAAIIFFSSLII